MERSNFWLVLLLACPLAASAIDWGMGNPPNLVDQQIRENCVNQSRNCRCGETSLSALDFPVVSLSVTGIKTGRTGVPEDAYRPTVQLAVRTENHSLNIHPELLGVSLGNSVRLQKSDLYGAAGRLLEYSALPKNEPPQFALVVCLRASYYSPGTRPFWSPYALRPVTTCRAVDVKYLAQAQLSHSRPWTLRFSNEKTRESGWVNIVALENRFDPFLTER